jgi:lipoate-protein ligase B
LEQRSLGRREYLEVWELQKDLAARRGRGEIEDTLLLVEHPPVYTRGTSSKSDWGPLPHPLHSVERGGDLTYHGPGQLVGYPIIHLGERGLTAGSYLRVLEQVLISALRPLGVTGETLKGFTGVWSGGRKIASIGVAVKGQVAYHGFAVNVSCDLSAFWRIHPCNLEPAEISTMEKVLGRPVALDEVRLTVADAFLARFPAAPAAAGR